MAQNQNQVVLNSKFNATLHEKMYKFSLFKRSSSFYVIMVFVAAIGAFLIYSTAISDQEGKGINMGISIAVVAMTLLLTPVMMVHKIKSNVKKDEQIRKDTNETIIVNKEKLSRKLQGAPEVAISWKKVEKAYEFDTHFFIFIQGDQSLIIDKNSFTEGDSELLVKLIEKYAPKTKKGKSILKRKCKGNK